MDYRSPRAVSCVHPFALIPSSRFSKYCSMRFLLYFPPTKVNFFWSAPPQFHQNRLHLYHPHQKNIICQKLLTGQPCQKSKLKRALRCWIPTGLNSKPFPKRIDTQITKTLTPSSDPRFTDAMISLVCAAPSKIMCILEGYRSAYVSCPLPYRTPWTWCPAWTPSTSVSMGWCLVCVWTRGGGGSVCPRFLPTFV